MRFHIPTIPIQDIKQTQQPTIASAVPWLRSPQDLITSHIVRVVMDTLAFRNYQTNQTPVQFEKPGCHYRVIVCGEKATSAKRHIQNRQHIVLK